jgi:hypothetical protein
MYYSLLQSYYNQYQSTLANQILKYFSICAVISLTLFQNTLAQNKSIRNLDIFIADNELNLICHFKSDFIDEDMRQTLSSGMSNTFNFQINLKYENGSVIRNHIVEVVIRYDIWEKQYLLFYKDQIQQFSTYQKFASFLYDSLTFDLGSIKGIDYKKPLQVIVFFSPEKISSAQKEKLNYWLTSNADTKESAPGMEQETGFSIDLSRLFSVFLSDKPKTNIQQYQSVIFNIENLRKNEKPAQ